MNEQNPFHLSQGFEVLAPRSGRAYPVPCDEWTNLKQQLQNVEHPPWFWQNVAALLIGAGLSTFITILVGGFDSQIEKIIAWAVVATCVVCGSLSCVFANLAGSSKRTQVSEVVKQMSLIESRYEPTLNKPPVAKLKIIRATYGKGEKWIDVTPALNSHITSNGRLRIVASNDLGGDPSKGTTKKLKVQYSVGNVAKAIEVEEGSILDLP